MTATTTNLQRIEIAEDIIRNELNMDSQSSFRVRHLLNESARIEFEEDVISKSSQLFPNLAEKISQLGFKSITFDKFKSGSVSKLIP